MKVRFEVTARVRYDGEMEMTQEQYDDWCKRIDSAKGFQRENVAQDLLDVSRMGTADPTDWDDFEVDTFETVDEESSESESEQS